MAKNRVYLTVLLALLAGCAVLTGCAGEGADDVSRNVGNSVNTTEETTGNLPPAKPFEVPILGDEPGAQWEPKQYWTSTIDEDFDGSNVGIIMGKNVGGPNKVHDKSFFGDIEIESIEDLAWFTGSYNNLGINWGIWRQLLNLKLPGDSKENVVRAIRHLEKIDGIKYAGPNHIWTWN